MSDFEKLKDQFIDRLTKAQNSIEVDIDADINMFTDPTGSLISNTFVALSAPSAEIEVKAPSIPRNFNASGGNEQVVLAALKKNIALLI